MESSPMDSKGCLTYAVLWDVLSFLCLTNSLSSGLNWNAFIYWEASLDPINQGPITFICFQHHVLYVVMLDI